MKSQAFIFLGLVFALLLLITSAVTADEAAAASKEESKVLAEEAKETNQYGSARGRRCPYGCCGYGGHGYCRTCCKSPPEAAIFLEANQLADANSNDGGGFEQGNWGGGGYHHGGGYGSGGSGGGRGWGGGGGRRCCANVEEARQFLMQNQANP